MSWYLAPSLKNTVKILIYFFSKVGFFIGNILGLRQTKKGVKIVATANQVTAKGEETLAAKSGFPYLKHHATTYACR